jgi:outer membrane lipopolysaccharide assembly protein LptE/RlpB
MNRNLTLMLTLGATALLAACGGGHSGSTDEVQATVPDSALASPQAYTDYVGSLPASETDAPVNVDKVGVAPSSDTTEPVALN